MITYIRVKTISLQLAVNLQLLQWLHILTNLTKFFYCDPVLPPLAGATLLNNLSFTI